MAESAEKDADQQEVDHVEPPGKKFLEHARALLRGNAQPKNDLSALIVDKLRTATAEHQALLTNIQTTEQQLVRAKQEAQKYEGALEAFFQALQMAESA